MGWSKRRSGRKRAPSHGKAGRRRLLLSGLLLYALLLAITAFRVAVVEHEAWLERASDQHADRMELPAPRGTIYDRDGLPLAASRQAYRLAIAPRQVSDSEALARKLREHAGLSAAEAKRALAQDRKWRVLRGRYDESVKEALDGVGGVHFQQVMLRFYPHGALAAELLGTVNSVGDALGGIELEFDSLLSGRPGLAVVRHGPNGRPIPGMMLRVTEPVPGRDVRLTIDYELQAIADDALRQALSTTHAAGGELLLLDPRTGEVLAAVSRRGTATASNWSAVTAPYEPGSTMKPFTVAAVLAERRATLGDSIYGEQGRYPLHGRVITDVHPFGWVTLADGLRQSSNVVMAKAGSRLTPEEHYRYLRDFGFGTPTGIPYPSESGGLLRRPPQWSRQSAASLAIGYEVSVTALQMALAYGALANGGVLMQPRLVREVRSRDGRIEESFAPRVVRRVVSEKVADEIRQVLIGAVEDGTGRAASMGPFKVAGKTGTARVALGGRYVQGAYTSTFAGFFPAVDPQLVFVVRLDQPQGAYYGGAIAAPVTRATLEAALAARGTPLDRRAVARRATAGPAPLDVNATRDGPVRPPIRESARVAATTAMPTPFSFARTPASPAAGRVVPDVAGEALREAVRLLHAAGYRVRVVGKGRARETVPRAGTTLEPGTVVRVHGGVQEP
jgi:cell division protein FtsI (penicillin-binding protein 3)